MKTMKKIFSIALICCVIGAGLQPRPLGAQTVLLPPDSAAGAVGLIRPVQMTGVLIDPKDAFSFDFIVEPGSFGSESEGFRAQTDKLLRYFFAALTIPERQMWVTH